MSNKKESAKERKDREKAEKAAAAQAAERLEQEVDEERARRQVELAERCERAEATVRFYETLAQPKNKMMVRQVVFDELEAKMRKDAECNATRLLRLQQEMYTYQKASDLIQKELVDVRTEYKLLANAISAETTSLRNYVVARLEDSVHAMEESVLGSREEVEDNARLLNEGLEKARLAHIKRVREVAARAHGVTELLQENTSMHTRVPGRIRRTLQRLERDDLLVILDTLSFEDSTLEYLQYKYPPTQDSPFEEAVEDM
jgi:hypothetical protein